MIKYKSAYVRDLVKIPTHDFGPSITQPDEALSIQQILDRVSRGLTTGLGASVSDEDYDDDDDEDFDAPHLQPGFDKLDALQMATSDESASIRERIKALKARRIKEQHDKLIDAEVQKRLKETNNKQNETNNKQNETN